MNLHGHRGIFEKQNKTDANILSDRDVWRTVVARPTKKNKVNPQFVTSRAKREILKTGNERFVQE